MNSIVFALEDYNNLDEMFQDIGKILQILTHTGYICTFRHDDCQIYVLEYDYKDRDLCDKQLEWLTDNELDIVYNYRYDKCDDSTEAECEWLFLCEPPNLLYKFCIG